MDHFSFDDKAINKLNLFYLDLILVNFPQNG